MFAGAATTLQWYSLREVVMTDLTFDSTICWKGRVRDGVGLVTTGGQEVTYSVASSMGGRGVGACPEELLTSAVAACYTATLFYLLTKSGIPASEVVVTAQGTVRDFPSRDTAFSQVVVNPTIMGADETRYSEYTAHARAARDHCFVGKALRETIRYEVAAVEVRASKAASSEVW
jgi:peroxiredoxin-like protein